VVELRGESARRSNVRIGFSPTSSLDFLSRLTSAAAEIRRMISGLEGSRNIRNG
jgi:hypothetical protein